MAIEPAAGVDAGALGGVASRLYSRNVVCRKAVEASFGLLLFACSITTSLEGLSGQPGPDGGSDVDAGPDTGASPPIEENDAGADAAPVVCEGGRLRAIAAFEATPAAATNGRACEVENVLVKDGLVAGLDAINYEGDARLDVQFVYGCVGVEFDRDILTAFVSLAASGNACGRACTGSQCGTGRDAAVFAGPARDTVKLVQKMQLESTIVESSVAVPNGTRVVVVCRLANSADRDDVAVDAIVAACK